VEFNLSMSTRELPIFLLIVQLSAVIEFDGTVFAGTVDLQRDGSTISGI
jgi:hypothetical protein